MFLILISLILFYFSYKQPKKLLKEPIRKNRTICLILGGINLIFFIQAFASIFTFKEEVKISFKLLSFVIAVLYGWFAYMNLVAVLKVKQYINTNQSTSKFCTKCGKEFEETDKFCTTCGSERPNQPITSDAAISINMPQLKFDKRT